MLRSLVGSEMCIRDRCLASGFTTEPVLTKPRGSAYNNHNNSRSNNNSNKRGGVGGSGVQVDHELYEAVSFYLDPTTQWNESPTTIHAKIVCFRLLRVLQIHWPSSGAFLTRVCLRYLSHPSRMMRLECIHAMLRIANMELRPPASTAASASSSSSKKVADTTIASTNSTEASTNNNNTTTTVPATSKSDEFSDECPLLSFVDNRGHLSARGLARVASCRGAGASSSSSSTTTLSLQHQHILVPCKARARMLSSLCRGLMFVAMTDTEQTVRKAALSQVQEEGMDVYFRDDEELISVLFVIAGDECQETALTAIRLLSNVTRTLR
eukprot:TRINITY_DN14413_c0_g1_i9.p1 TRINITY_DN14413_c0_g1~~TRINITY_DN14413_c0_g1_i9.p1  ORF type:complete len:325 (-),score=67.13 TRINITY_DN14413_c0_g1_i9:4-978(-)